MPDNLGNWGANTALGSILNIAGLYLALHVSDPNVLDPSATELAGGGYSRQPIFFATVSGRTGVSSTAQNYSGLPAATINFLAVWTAVADGFLVFAKDITATPLIALASGFLYVQPGDMALSF